MVYLIKHSAQNFSNKFGAFISCEKRDSWVAAMEEAMKAECEGRADRHDDGCMFQYIVVFEKIADQEAFDAYRHAQFAAPVLNSHD